MLGPVFHVSIIYANEIGYVVKSEILSDLFYSICHLIHSFRMPLFFFLSGFFSELVLNKKGEKNFIKNRIEKILIPAIFGIFTFATIESYFYYIQKNHRVTFLEFYSNFFTKEYFTFSHIWFLVNLFLYSILFFFVRKIEILKVKFINLVGLSFLVLMSNFFIGKNFTFLQIKVLDFFYYFSFFYFGISTFREKKISSILKLKQKTFFLFLSILYINYFYINFKDPLWVDFKYIPYYRIFHLFLESLLSWSMILFLIHLFQNRLNFESKILNYLKESGISVYLVHHAISIWIGFYFIDLNLNLYLKFFIHLGSVYSCSFLFYEIMKKNKLTKFLLGTK